MSILIKGMEMPNHCEDCFIETYCYHNKLGRWSMGKGKPCPLESLPEGHGRLIDADKLMEKGVRMSWSVQKWVQEVDIMLAPTIVPAEGGGEDGN